METEEEITELKKLLNEAITPRTRLYNLKHYEDDTSEIFDKILSCFPSLDDSEIDKLLNLFFQSYDSNKDFNNAFESLCIALKQPSLNVNEDPYFDTLEGKLRLCKNCSKPIPHNIVDSSKYNYERCEKTGINDKCYLFGIKCRDVKTGDESCRNVKPEPSWADEVKKRKYTNKIMIEGKVNVRKLKKELKEHGAQYVEYKNTDDYRGGVAKARYFLIQKHMIGMEPIADKKFCSEQCKNAHNSKNV